MTKSEEMLIQAQALLTKKDFLKAENLFLKLVQEFPGHAEAWYDLSGIQINDGRLNEAETSLNNVLKLNPNNPPTWSRLGNLYWQMGRLADSATCFTKLMELDPVSFAAANNLGNAFLLMGRVEEAIEVYKKAVEIAPERSESYNNLGAAFLGLGRYQEAADAFAESIARAPDFAASMVNLAAALTRLEKWDEAKAQCSVALEIAPDLAEAHNIWGNILTQEGESLRAFQAYQKAVELRPNFVEAHLNLGRLMQRIGRHQDAANHFKRVISLDNNQPAAFDALGVALQALGKTGEAINQHYRALQLKEDFADAHLNLGNAYLSAGFIDDAIDQYQKLLALKPKDQDAWDNFLLALNYHAGLAPFDVFIEHRRWADGLKLKSVELQPFKHKRIRVGYVSGDFRTHSVGYFIEPVLARHKEVEVFIYSGVSNPDETTERMKNYGHNWRDVFALNDTKLAELIKEDEIDILVDLSGHTGGNRLRVMAMKPAPITVTWLGYPNSTGLENMDWRISDNWADPIGKEGFCSEKLCYLPGFLCYAPPVDAPFVSSLPVLSRGYITFGSFNNLSKLTDKDVELWAKILHAISDSRLFLKARPFGDEWVRKQVQERFLKVGIPVNRIELLGRTSRVSQHLDYYSEIDIALDSIHYNGTTTTCEALWMGRPVISLEGGHHAARVGKSILNRANLAELVAETPEDYVAKAVDLANDLPRLQQLSQNLREIMLASSLLDAEAFIKELEAAYKRMLAH